MTRKRKNGPNRGARKGGQNKKSHDNWDNHDDRAIETENEKFEMYYKAQQIVPESEWDAFMQALRQPLPSTFRVAGHRETREDIKKSIIDTYVPQLQTASFEGDPLPVPKPIPWYPGELAWKINVEKKSLRKSPEYKRFHNFLVYETDVGNISRQEAVSMIPPLFLDVKPHHYVIDMCAAPGSKTSQILEAMHSAEKLDDIKTGGLLIANDSDYRRAQLLVHTTARLPSPGIMVTNLDVSNFPIIKIPKNINAASPLVSNSTKGKEPATRQLRFHRILSDVPCSGDGTLRKNLRIWKTWSPMDGNGLHTLQLRILQRAMRMLIFDRDGTSTGTSFDVSTEKEKGRIVYSTCSFNPVENEAVVAAALNSVPGYEVVDVSSHLPELERRSGLIAWQPAIDRDVDLTCKTYEQYVKKMEELNNEQVHDVQTADRPKRSKMTETLWPPSNATELGLENCMRIYPHLQDSGGFFIAVLQRKNRQAVSVNAASESLSASDKQKRPVPDEGSIEDQSSMASKKAKLSTEETGEDDMQVDEPVLPEDDQKSANAAAEDPAETTKPGKQTTGGRFKENPFTFIPPDEPGILGCIKRLRLSPDFPSGNIFVRNPVGEPMRSLYLVNDAVKAVMQSIDYTRIRLVSAGVKMFGRSEFFKQATAGDPSQANDELQFRVLSDGMSIVLNYADESTFIKGDAHALRLLLETYFPLTASFSDPFKTEIESKAIGSHVGCFEAGDYAGTRLNHDLILPLWKSEKSASLMIDKTAKKALSLRLFGEDITAASRNEKEKLAEKKGAEPTELLQEQGEMSVPAEDVEEHDIDDGSDKEDS